MRSEDAHEVEGSTSTSLPRLLVALVLIAGCAVGAATWVAVIVVRAGPADEAFALAGITVGAVLAWMVRGRMTPGGRGSGVVWFAGAGAASTALASASEAVAGPLLAAIAGFLGVCCVVVWRNRPR